MPITQPADEDFDLTAHPGAVAERHLGGRPHRPVPACRRWRCTGTGSPGPRPRARIRNRQANSPGYGRSRRTTCGRSASLLRTAKTTRRWSSTGTAQAWTVAKASFPGDLLAVGATSGKDVWAVGQVFTGHRDETLILHWDGHRWVRKTSPNPGPTRQRTEFGDRHLGQQRLGGRLRLEQHRHGLQHRRADADPALGRPHVGQGEEPQSGRQGQGRRAVGVAAISASRLLVAVGTAFVSHQTIILQWNGKSWVRTPSPERGPGDPAPGGGGQLGGQRLGRRRLPAGGPDQVFATHFAAPALVPAGCWRWLPGRDLRPAAEPGNGRQRVHRRGRVVPVRRLGGRRRRERRPGPRLSSSTGTAPPGRSCPTPSLGPGSVP